MTAAAFSEATGDAPDLRTTVTVDKIGLTCSQTPLEISTGPSSVWSGRFAMRTMSSAGTFLKDVKAERTTAMAFLEEARSDPHVKLFVKVGTARATHLIGGALITKYSNVPG